MSTAAVEQSKLPRAIFVFFLHMVIGKINWREAGDLIINRIKDKHIILHKRHFFHYLLFWRVFLPSVGCRVGLYVDMG
jgi:hypothetical protein